MNQYNVPQGMEPGQPGGGPVRPVSNQAKSGQYRLAKIVIIAAVVVLAIIVFLAVQSCGRFNLHDPRAEVGQLLGKTSGEIQAELDREVEEGMFNISIASVIELATGTSEGEIRIENVPGNRYDMQVTVVDDNTGEVYYETALIQPNRHIQSDVLLKDLEPGTYPCTAIFTAFDPETIEEVGQAAAKITILVRG